ncbi:hypothetical protein [Gracilibacillus lacisalsi]|uniref:hypothetical protein n=1 Tax=Gracilibacillus lacisalsi TaxID=393087 RepID=UPI00036AA72A|nr:hypothetical protein [Gracilibacillus lacisalsi]
MFVERTFNPLFESFQLTFALFSMNSGIDVRMNHYSNFVTDNGTNVRIPLRFIGPAIEKEGKQGEE